MKIANLNKKLIAVAISSACAVGAISSNAIAKNNDAKVDGLANITVQL